MRGSDEKKALNPNDFWEVNHAASRLTSYACSVSARHIQDTSLRLQFNREVAYYMRGIVRDVESGERSVTEGLKAIWRQKNDLLKASTVIGGQAVGLAAGAMQFRTGITICKGGYIACGVAGGWVSAHGVNNIYENGNNLIRGRTDTVGPVRKAYQWIASSEQRGNIAYGSVDIIMTAGTLVSLQRKPGAWRIFKYIRTDYLRGFQMASKSSLIVDGLSTGSTVYGINEELKKENTEK